MNLSRARLCPEATCQEIFDLVDSDTCPRCHSEGLSLRRVLDDRPSATPLVEATRALLDTGILTRAHRRSLLGALSVLDVRKPAASAEPKGA